MFARWTDAGKEYKAKCRQLSFNLRDPKNPDLRRSVADGFIAADRLLDLSPEDLASEEKRRDNAKIREHATNEAVRGQRKEASTDAFKCGKCKQRKCTYYQLQTRSADEPMTTFVTCVNCDNRWKNRDFRGRGVVLARRAIHALSRRPEDASEEEGERTARVTTVSAGRRPARVLKPYYFYHILYGNIRARDAPRRVGGSFSLQRALQDLVDLPTIWGRPSPPRSLARCRHLLRREPSRSDPRSARSADDVPRVQPSVAAFHRSSS